MILFFIRGINLFKITFSYLISRISHRVIHWGNPLAVSIEPTNTCNLRCPECPAGTNDLTRPHGFMKPELFKSIIGQLLPSLSYLTLYFQGEPYLNKYIFNFIAFAESKKIFVASSTNGHFLDELSVKQTIESGLNLLIISIDGADQQSYEAYRQGGDFDKVAAGIRLLVNERKRLKRQNPEIVLQCLLLKSTEQHLAEIRKFGNDLGVDKITFKTAQFNDYENGNPLMPETLKYARYKKIAEIKMQNVKCKMQNAKIPGHNAETSDPDKINQHINTSAYQHINTSPDQHINTSPHQHINTLAHQHILPSASSPRYSYVPKNRMPNACFRMWSSCVITWDGKVVPCCFDKDATHVMGDLTKQDFTEIWRNPQYHDFRQNILRKRKSTAICRNCTQTF